MNAIKQPRHSTLAAPLLALLLVVLAPLAQAHTVFASLTRVDHNERTGTLEIIHRFAAHDIEAVLSVDMGRKVTFVTDEDRTEMLRLTQALVERGFSLTADGQPLPLTTAGIELEGQDLLIYREARLDGGTLPERLDITNTLLVDYFANQQNSVILQVGERLLSVTTTRGDTDRSITIDADGTVRLVTGLETAEDEALP